MCAVPQAIPARPLISLLLQKCESCSHVKLNASCCHSRQGSDVLPLQTSLVVSHLLSAGEPLRSNGSIAIRSSYGDPLYARSQTPLSRSAIWQEQTFVPC